MSSMLWKAYMSSMLWKAYISSMLWNFRRWKFPPKSAQPFSDQMKLAMNWKYLVRRSRSRPRNCENASTHPRPTLWCVPPTLRMLPCVFLTLKIMRRVFPTLKMLRCVFPTLRMLLCVLPQAQDDAMCPFPSSSCCTSSRSSESWTTCSSSTWRRCPRSRRTSPPPTPIYSTSTSSSSPSTINPSQPKEAHSLSSCHHLYCVSFSPTTPSPEERTRKLSRCHHLSLLEPLRPVEDQEHCSRCHHLLCVAHLLHLGREHLQPGRCHHPGHVCLPPPLPQCHHDVSCAVESREEVSQ